MTGVGRNRHNEGGVVGYYLMQLVAPVSLTDHVLKPNGGGVRVEDMLPFTRARPLECYITGSRDIGSTELCYPFERKTPLLLRMGMKASPPMAAWDTGSLALDTVLHLVLFSLE